MAAGNPRENRLDVSHVPREWIKVVVLIFAAVAGVNEFVVKDIVRPAQEPTALNVKATLENLGETNGMAFVRVGLLAHNPTDRRTYVPAYWFTLRGVKLRDRPISDLPDYSAILYRAPAGQRVTTFTEIAASQILAQKRIYFSRSSWMDPDEQSYQDHTIGFPAGVYDYVEVYAAALHTRFVRDISDPNWVPETDGSWHAEFVLATNQDVDRWQLRTSSGRVEYITTLPLF